MYKPYFHHISRELMFQYNKSLPYGLFAFHDEDKQLKFVLHPSEKPEEYGVFIEKKIGGDLTLNYCPSFIRNSEDLKRKLRSDVELNKFKRQKASPIIQTFTNTNDNINNIYSIIENPSLLKQRPKPTPMVYESLGDDQTTRLKNKLMAEFNSTRDINQLKRLYMQFKTYVDEQGVVLPVDDIQDVETYLNNYEINQAGPSRTDVIKFPEPNSIGLKEGSGKVINRIPRIAGWNETSGIYLPNLKEEFSFNPLMVYNNDVLITRVLQKYNLDGDEDARNYITSLYNLNQETAQSVFGIYESTIKQRNLGGVFSINPILFLNMATAFKVNATIHKSLDSFIYNIKMNGLIRADNIFLPQRIRDQIKDIEAFQNHVINKFSELYALETNFAPKVIYSNDIPILEPKYYELLNIPNADTLLYTRQRITSFKMNGKRVHIYYTGNGQLYELPDKFVASGYTSRVVPFFNGANEMQDNIFKSNMYPINSNVITEPEWFMNPDNWSSTKIDNIVNMYSQVN